MRRTKIICTIGPASAAPDVLEALVRAGMDVARLNFSHGTHEEHAQVIARIREAEPRWGKPVAIMQDLQGPKVRLGRFPDGAVALKAGDAFTLTRREIPGTASAATITQPELLSALGPGDPVWLDDGMVQLRVEALQADGVRCRVIVGGRLSDHKGVAFPRSPTSVSCFTDKDREDLQFGIERGVDCVAVSFVRSAADVEEVRGFLHERGADLPLVAKLERAEAMENLAGILARVDAVILARGDLGVDVPLEDVPVIQKEVIRHARLARVPVIVATQMLESMVSHLRPTRAEVSDVATAIFDGADAMMLSAETATGQYPVEAVEVMARVAERAERAYPGPSAERRPDESHGFPEATSAAACHAARTIQAKAIVAFTQSGFTARLISQDRPPVPIIALTPDVTVQRRLALCWGVSSRLIRKVETTDEMIEEIEATLRGDGTVSENDLLVIISGAPMWVAGTTNLLKLHRVGEPR